MISLFKTTILLCFFIAPLRSFAGELIMQSQKINSSKGQVIFSLCDNEKCWDAENGYYTEVAIRAIDSKKQVIIKDLPPGFYAVSAFHDKNEDGIHNKNIFGVPKEKFAISKITQKLWSKPSWSKVKVLIGTGTTKINLLFKKQ